MRSLGWDNHFPIIFPPGCQGRYGTCAKPGWACYQIYPGDRKPVPVTEDTPYNPAVLPGYIEEFNRMLAKTRT